MSYKLLNRKNLMLFITLAGVIGFCLFLWYLRIAPSLGNKDAITIPSVEFYSESHIYDLRDFDFENSIAIINGKEQYFTGELLTPEEFSKREDEAQIGHPFNDPVDTSRMIYLLPDDGRYIFTDNSIDFAERLYVNGELVTEVGNVALTAEESVPDFDYLTVELRPQNGVVEIIRQGNNFVYYGDNVASTIVLGKADLMQTKIAFDYGISGVIVALFFTLSIAHLLLYTVMKKYTAHLYFTALSFVWGFRMGITGIVIFGEWFPTLSWELGFRLQYFTLPMSVALIFFITMTVLPKALPKRLLQIGGILCVAYAIICMFAPTLPLSLSMRYFQMMHVYIMAILGIASVFCVGRMLYKRTAKLEHLLFVIGLLPMVLSTLNDTVHYRGSSLFGPEFLMGDLAMMLFVFIQTAALFYDTGRKTEVALITEQQSRTEAETLRRAGEMKEEFMRTISHELQMPLATVTGYAQFTDKLANEDDNLDIVTVKNNMRIINDEAIRLSRMVKQLLDMSAIDAGTFKLYLARVDINELLLKVTAQYLPIMNDGSITIKTKIPEYLPFVYGDDERLIQSILNIITNAVKYARCNEITLSATDKKDFVQINISDNGEGISPELLPDLFSRYPKNRSEKGNGLGLYIVAQTIEAHGGNINIESELNKGTTITLTVPIFKEGDKNERK